MTRRSPEDFEGSETVRYHTLRVDTYHTFVKSHRKDKHKEGPLMESQALVSKDVLVLVPQL